MHQEKSTVGSFYKVWDILCPFVMYYVLHLAAFYLLSFLFQVSLEVFGQVYEDYMTAHAATVTGLVSGLAMLLAAAPLVPMLRQELRERRERDTQEGRVFCGEDGSNNRFVLQEANQRGRSERKVKAEEQSRGTGRKVKAEEQSRGTEQKDGTESQGRTKQGRKLWTTILTLLLAVSVSLGLNMFFTLTGLAESSDTFQDVTGRQFGVAFGVGIILYGVVSPFAEEIVFRGLLYNRMRKYYPVWLAVIVSGLFFGLYHGNLVQGIYGTCMGIVMAYLYERMGRFLTPLLFHGTANIAVYTAGSLPMVQESFWGAGNCAVLLTISILCIVLLEKVLRLEKK